MFLSLSLVSSPLLCKKNQASTGSGKKKKEEVLRNPQYAVLVTFHELSQFVFQEAQSPSGPCVGTCIRSVIPFHHFFCTSLGPVPWLTPCGEK